MGFGKNLQTAFFLAIVSRIFIFFVAQIGEPLVPENFGSHWLIDIPYLHLFAKWDSIWYLNIARTGYLNPDHFAFFPLYPLLMKIFTLPSSDVIVSYRTLVLTGFLISNFFFLASSIVIFKLTRLLGGRDDYAFYASFFFSIFPSSIFLSAIYSESMFLFLTLGALYYWRKGSPLKVTLLAFAASLTRPVGILLVIPLLYDFVIEKYVNITYPSRNNIRVSILRKTVAKRNRKILALSSPILGYLSYVLFTYSRTGNPFAQFQAEESFWGTGYHDPIHALSLLNVHFSMELLFQVIIVSFFILALVPFISKILNIQTKIIPTSYLLYSAALLGLYLFIGEILAFPRFALTLIPIYMGMSYLSTKRLPRLGLIVFSLIFLTIGTLLFTNWYEFR